MLEKTIAFKTAELKCEVANAKLQAANTLRWGYAALCMLVFNSQVNVPFGGVVIGLLALYLVPFSYRRELNRSKVAFEKVTGAPFQTALVTLEP
jgi:hypothetical protein